VSAVWWTNKDFLNCDHVIPPPGRVFYRSFARTVHACAALVEAFFVFTSAAQQRAAQRMYERPIIVCLVQSFSAVLCWSAYCFTSVLCARYFGCICAILNSMYVCYCWQSFLLYRARVRHFLWEMWYIIVTLASARHSTSQWHNGRCFEAVEGPSFTSKSWR